MKYVFALQAQSHQSYTNAGAQKPLTTRFAVTSAWEGLGDALTPALLQYLSWHSKQLVYSEEVFISPLCFQKM